MWQTNFNGSDSGHDLVADHVGHRHFRGGNQVEPAAVGTRHAEQVFLELGQLAGTEHAVRIDQVRHIDFGVAMLGGMGIQHELRQRAVQPGDAAFHERKAAAGDPYGGLEIEPAELFAELDVVLDRKVEAPRRAPAQNFDIARFITAHRHALVRQVGDHRDEGVVALLERRQGILVRLQLVADAGHLGHHRRDILALALQHADLLRQAVSFRLQVLGADLQVLALGLQRLEGGGVERRAARGEAFGDQGEVGAQQLNVQHVDILFFCHYFLALRSRSRRCASFSAIFCSSPRGVGWYHSTRGMSWGK